MTDKQKHALNLLAAAYGALSDAWDDAGNDKLGNKLADLGVLPLRDLTEAESEIFHLLG